MVVVLGLVIGRMPALPALLIGALTGCLFAVLFQQQAVLGYVDDPALPTVVALLKGAWISLFDGFQLQSGNEALDELLSRGGMSGMLSTVWLILSAMMFGAVMETTGMLQRIAASILGAVRGTGSLITATLATAIGMNVVASDQYIAIVLPGRMFRAEYARRGLRRRTCRARSRDRDGHLAARAVEHLRRLHGADARRRDVRLRCRSRSSTCSTRSSIAIYGFTGFTLEDVQGRADAVLGLQPQAARIHDVRRHRLRNGNLLAEGDAEGRPAGRRHRQLHGPVTPRRRWPVARSLRHLQQPQPAAGRGALIRAVRLARRGAPPAPAHAALRTSRR
jgi:hypothetical protein